MQGDRPEKPPLQRPDVSLINMLVKFVLWIALMGGFWALCICGGSLLVLPTAVAHAVATAFTVLIVALKAKTVVCGAVLLYQKYAPEKMRNACLFTPSCSEYMLLAIDKYGVVVGVCKGIGRLLRCHHPNGGVDYP